MKIAIVALLALAACSKKTPPGQPAMASPAQCRQLMERVRSLADLAPDSDPEVAAIVDGILTQVAAEGADSCTRRMTAKQVECALAAPDLEALAACEPEVDPRPPGERPTLEECERLEDRAYALLDGSLDRDRQWIAELEHEIAGLRADPDANPDHVAEREQFLADRRASLARMAPAATQMSELAYRECRRSQPLTEVRCQIAATELAGFIACARRGTTAP